MGAQEVYLAFPHHDAANAKGAQPASPRWSHTVFTEHTWLTCQLFTECAVVCSTHQLSALSVNILFVICFLPLFRYVCIDVFYHFLLISQLNNYFHNPHACLWLNPLSIDIKCQLIAKNCRRLQEKRSVGSLVSKSLKRKGTAHSTY